MKWVRIKKLVDMCGYSEHAIRAKQKKGVWLKDKHWRKAPDGCILFNTQEIEAWVEGKTA